MAKNPMQRKAQNSFLLGMVVTLLITGAIIVLLVVQLTKITNAQKEAEKKIQKVYVLAEDIGSGGTVSTDKLVQKDIDGTLIPENAIKLAELDAMSNILDEEGNNVIKKVNIISKIDLKKGTILTSDMITPEGELQSDTRRVEYNMFALPTQLETDKYIDIRLRLPNNADYTVVTHKKVTIVDVGGVESINTISLNLSELEILTLSGAIVESYKIEGSMLYITEYVEPGLQEAATPTFVPDNTTLKLIQESPNCVQEAKQALFNRLYDSNGNQKDGTQQTRYPIDSALKDNEEDAMDNAKSKVEDEIKTKQEQRQLYLDSLGY